LCFAGATARCDPIRDDVIGRPGSSETARQTASRRISRTAGQKAASGESNGGIKSDAAAATALPERFGAKKVRELSGQRLAQLRRAKTVITRDVAIAAPCAHFAPESTAIAGSLRMGGSLIAPRMSYASGDLIDTAPSTSRALPGAARIQLIIALFSDASMAPI